jgi:hypothetical protein
MNFNSHNRYRKENQTRNQKDLCQLIFPNYPKSFATPSNLQQRSSCELWSAVLPNSVEDAAESKPQQQLNCLHFFSSWPRQPDPYYTRLGRYAPEACAEQNLQHFGF